MAMRIDEARQERVIVKIDNFLGRMLLRDFREFANIRNPTSRNCDRAVLDRRSVHCHDRACANDHSSISPLTTLRHSATSRLHGSLQSTGIAFWPRAV